MSTHMRMHDKNWNEYTYDGNEDKNRNRVQNCKTYLGTRPPKVFVHLNGVTVLNLLSPPVGASTSPLNRPTYSVNTPVTSSTLLPGLLINSSNLCLLALI